MEFAECSVPFENDISTSQSFSQLQKNDVTTVDAGTRRETIACVPDAYARVQAIK